MSNEKPYGNLLKFKDLKNENYEVDVKGYDLVVDIKKKLSKKVNKNYKNIIRVFKTKLLFDDKLISFYKIESSAYVLWFEGENCIRYSSGDFYTIKCITIIDNDNDDEYFVNMNRRSTVGTLKSIIAKKYELNKNQFYLKFNETNSLIDDGTILEQCGLNNGCIIYLVKLNKEFGFVRKNYSRNKIYNGKYLDNEKQRIEFICTLGISADYLSVISLADEYESFMVPFIFDLNDLIVRIRWKNRIYDSIVNNLSIKLYSDANKINQITKDDDLRVLYKNASHDKQIKIYCEIISQFDEYEMIVKLGKGSFGNVYKCRNKNTNKIFALKIFDFSTDSLIKEKYQREVDCYLKLKFHPRIIKYEKHFIEKHKSYILMECMERGSLGKFVKNNDFLSEPKIAKYARQILEGLEFLHENKILHRDLKGDNILLDENDNLKLCDFGLAKILTDISSGEFLNGVVQSTVATLNWMSPEIISNEECGPASDIWSFGATMVEIITRKYPHAELPIGRILLNILAGKIKFDYPENSSNQLKMFINSCLKKNPKERASIKELYQKSFLKKDCS